MTSFGHRHLLRLRRVPRPRSAVPVRVRTSATRAFEADPLNQPLPAYMLRPSSMASSSRLTLDAFLNRGTQEDMIMSALSFAAEDELVAAAIAAPSKAKRPAHWIEPSAAYLRLRSSGLFSHHLQTLIPRIRTLYANLRPSGMHQMLVSDLLLRNPDPRALREILQEEADPSHPHKLGDRLRPGLVLQAYRAIAPGIRRQVVPRLSRSALLCVTRSLRLQSEDEAPELLSDLFYELAHTTNWEPEGIWPLLEIVLRLTQFGHTAEALRLLQYPIQLGKLPSDALRAAPLGHPRAAELLIQSTVVRTLLSWGFDERAMRAVDDLVDTMVESLPSDAGVELVLTACRVAVLTPNKHSIQWARQTLLRLANDERFPVLSSGTINLQLDALSTGQALQFYSQLPARHDPPSPEHILRLALGKPTRALSRRLAVDLSRTPGDAVAAIPGMLRALASARMLRLTRWAYEAWDARDAYIDSPTVVALVHAFTRGSRTAENTAFANIVLNDYLETTGKRVSAVDAALTALHAYGLISKPKSKKVSGQAPANEAETKGPEADPAAEHVSVLIRTLGHSGALERLMSLSLEYPLLAHRLVQIGKAHGLVLPPTAVIIASACAARHWGALSVASSLNLAADEEAYIQVLNAARKSRRTALVTRLRAAIEAHPDSPLLVPTAAAVLQRLAGMRAWREGTEVLALVLGDGSVEAASVFLSALQREASGIPAENALLVAREAVERVEDAREETAKVEIFIDSVDGQPDAAGVRAHEALIAARGSEIAKASRDSAREAWSIHGAAVRERVGDVQVMGRTLLETMCDEVDEVVQASI